MLATAIGAIIISIIGGVCLATCLVLCCLKRYQSGQKKRLEKAGHQDLRFYDSTRQVQMATQPDTGRDSKIVSREQIGNNDGAD